MMEGYTILSLLLCLSVASAFSNMDVRLAGTGSDERMGRVEIYYNGEWGTVCDDDWDITDAGVVCKQLGYPEGASAFTIRAREFGQGSGSILLDQVACTGKENQITDCTASRIGYTDCSHFEDAGVKCQGARTGGSSSGASSGPVVRLAGSGSSAYQGRVEVYANGQWGTVCDNLWGQTDADVVCMQLGFPGASDFTTRARTFGLGSGPILLGNVECVGDETSIMDCPKNAFRSSDCSHFEDAGVICHVAQGDRRKVEDLELYEKKEEEVAAEVRSDDKKDADLKKKDILQALADLLAKLEDK